MPAEAFYALIIMLMIFSSVFTLCHIEQNKYSSTSIMLAIITYAVLIAFLYWNIGPVIESKNTYKIKLSNSGYPYYEHNGGICPIDPKQNVKEGDIAVFTRRHTTTKIGLNFGAETTLEVMSPEDAN